ncbi:hypothetical protein DPSP01_000492 [Paraphaeosphaeria sporulosa]
MPGDHTDSATCDRSLHTQWGNESSLPHAPVANNGACRSLIAVVFETSKLLRRAPSHSPEGEALLRNRPAISQDRGLALHFQPTYMGLDAFVSSPEAWLSSFILFSVTHLTGLVLHILLFN